MIRGFVSEAFRRAGLALSVLRYGEHTIRHLWDVLKEPKFDLKGVTDHYQYLLTIFLTFYVFVFSLSSPDGTYRKYLL